MKHTTLNSAGVLLWWAEGTKSRKDPRWKNAVTYPVEITNMDSKVIKIFLAFLRRNFKINEHRLKVQIQIHEGDDIDAFERYWSKITGINRKQFNKTIIRKNGKKIRQSFGTCKVRYTDKRIYLELEQSLKKILTSLGV